MNAILNDYIDRLMSDYDKVFEARQKVSDYVQSSEYKHSQYLELKNDLMFVEHDFCTMFGLYVRWIFANPDFKLVAEARDKEDEE